MSRTTVETGFYFQQQRTMYHGADKALAEPTSRCILFYGENISFEASLVIYINSTNIPTIVIINRIYETQNLLSLYLVSFLVELRTYQHSCTPLQGLQTANDSPPVSCTREYLGWDVYLPVNYTW
jgi:hypothetical protein